MFGFVFARGWYAGIFPGLAAGWQPHRAGVLVPAYLEEAFRQLAGREERALLGKKEEKKKLTEPEIRLSRAVSAYEAVTTIIYLLISIIHHNSLQLPHESSLLISPLLFRDLKALHKH